MPQLSPTLWQMHFPKGGVDLSRAFGRQPNRDVGEGTYARTTPRGVNVRAFEQAGRRRRGGSRRGLSKFIDAIPGGTEWLVQHLAAIATTGTAAVPIQSSASGRRVTLFAVVQGTPYTAEPAATSWTAVTNNASTTPPLNFSGLMASTALFQKLWLADGSRYRVYDPVTNAIGDWTPTAGTMPQDADGNRARLLVGWQGRVVAAGLVKDPHNWFMSRKGDPLDWEYGASANDSAQAVSGNNPSLGKAGDVITSLIPYSDDVLVFGCDSSILVMRGDPYRGGSQFELLTDRVGIAWGVPWTRSPDGTLFVFSTTGGVYALNPTTNQPPVRISQPIEPLVQGVNTGTNTVLMEWDDTHQELRVFVTRTSGRAVTDHYTWEARTRAWWVDRFSDTRLNPLAACVLDGNRPQDRTVLLGGWDGYVRKLDPDATTDDGEPIESSVVVGPLRTPNLDDVTTDQLQAVMGEDSGDVELEFLAGKTAEAALASDPIPVGTVGAGRSPTFSRRVAGHATYLRVSQSGEAAMDGWALEEFRLRVQPKGTTRRRVK